MTEMLTAKDMQALLQVDRSTIYRMAVAKRLPAIKVGKQWRFPADQVEKWLQRQAIPPAPNPQLPKTAGEGDFASLLPLVCVQLVQDTFAEALGVTIIITDMSGNPVTEISKPCGLFRVISQTPHALQKCIQGWADLGRTVDLEPRFTPNRMGLLGARGLVRIGTELKGMVIIGGIAPADWPPSPDRIAARFDLPVETIAPHLNDVFYLDPAQQTLVLSQVQRIADILAHIVTERAALIGKLTTIADLITR